MERKMTLAQKLDALQEILNNAPDYELQDMWNKRCEEYGDDDRHIYNMTEIDEYIGKGWTSDILARLNRDFCIDDDYFREEWDEIVSFSDLYLVIDDAYLLEYIIGEDDDFDNEEIREILDAEEVEEED